MAAFTKLLTGSVLSALAIGGLVLLADGARRSRLQTAIHAGRPVPGIAAPSARSAEAYNVRGLDRMRLQRTVEMIAPQE